MSMIRPSYSCQLTTLMISRLEIKTPSLRRQDSQEKRRANLLPPPRKMGSPNWRSQAWRLSPMSTEQSLLPQWRRPIPYLLNSSVTTASDRYESIVNNRGPITNERGSDTAKFALHP